MIDPGVLRRLESDVVASLSGDTSIELDIVGYGEISTVLRAEGTNGQVVAKRLPQMTRAQLGAYAGTLSSYLHDLEARGVNSVPSTILSVGSDPVTPYCIQPFQERLLVDELRAADTATVEHRMSQLVGLVVGATDRWLGLDGQVSNWAIREDSLVYFDITTPLRRDVTGADELDSDLFIASLPWAMRAPVKRFLLGEILSHYYDPRSVLLDVAGNLFKERLESAIDPLLVAANAAVSPAITVDEARRYYRSDAMMWEVLQRLRQTDRWWQKTIRHREYPFLLPGQIER